MVWTIPTAGFTNPPERDGQLCLRGALTDGDALDVCVQADS